MAIFSVPYMMLADCRNTAAEIELVVTNLNIYQLQEFVENNRKEHKGQRIVLNVGHVDSKNAELCSRTIDSIYAEDIIIKTDYSLFHFYTENYDKKWNVRYMDICRNWDEYYEILTGKVFTEIRIGGELLFDLVDVEAMAKRYKKKLCVPANMAIGPEDERFYLASFVRPEDISWYEEYIDIFELSSTRWADATALDTVYDIYTKDKRWDGPLNTLIIANDKLNDKLGTIEGNRLLNDWSKYRLNCGRVCMKGHSCRICPSQLSIADSLKQAGVVFVREQKEKKENEV